MSGSDSRPNRRGEEMLAILFGAAVLVVGGAALYFVATISVHSDPASIPSSALSEPDERYSSAVDEARRLARTLIVQENLPGLSVAVAIHGGIAWAEAFGWANVEHRIPMTPLTRLRIGSVSIPLTAAAVGLLHERGRLDLDAPVQRYIPAFPVKQWPVSTRQAMAHVAGIRTGVPSRHCASLDEALRLFSGGPLLFRPGTQYRYSTYDWILVSAVVEAAAGEPFYSFMQRDVVAALAMDSTIPDADGVDGRASFYFPRAAQRTDFGLQDAPAADYSCSAGSGAFLSTPADLVRFGSAMLKPGLLQAATIALLQTPLRLESGAATGYALGWNVETVHVGGAPARLVGHRGSSMGGTTSLMTFPELDLVLAVASNVSYARGVPAYGLKVADAFSRETKATR